MATVELTSIQHTLTEHLLMLSTRCILSTERGREGDAGTISMGLVWGTCLLTRHGLKCDGCKAESDGRWHEEVFVTLLKRQMAVSADEGERSRGDCI